MPGSAIHRRSLLRGMGGISVALPVLEIMDLGLSRKARAAAVRPYFCSSYAGLSLGTSTAPFEMCIPKAQGVDFATAADVWGLRSLVELDKVVKKEFGVVSGLKLPWGSSPSSVPPGGRPTGFHGTTKGPQLSGARLLKADGSEEQAKGATCDQLMASLIGRESRFPKVSYRVQNTGNIGGDGGTLSYDSSGRAFTSQASPRVAYTSLFGEGVSGDNGTTIGPGAIVMELARRKSVLDVVSENTQRLLARLGPEDKRRIDRHFTEIRSLETRIVALEDDARNAPAIPACKPLKTPSDPGTTMTGNPDQTDGGDWSNETLRAELLMDALAMAYVCGLTRVGSVLVSGSGSSMAMSPIDGAACNMHGAGHYQPGGGNKTMADAVNWSVRTLARLVWKLLDIREVDGSRLLDHAAFFICFEGGHGYDPSGGAEGDSEYKNGIHSPHSTENMMIVFAGGAGGLKRGQHLQFKNDRSPVEAILTLMRATGWQGPLGDISTEITEMRT